MVTSPITPQGFERLSVELKHRKNVERHEISRAIETAREHGDLKENAEYHAAKDKQGMAEARIRHLEAVLGEAQIVDPKKQPSSKIGFGAFVTVVDLETEVEATYQIVGEHESDLDQGRISIKAGTLDDASWLKPQVHLWTKSRQPWVIIPDDADAYETQRG